MTDGVEPSPWDRHGWLMGAVWIVFLGFPVHGAATADRDLTLRIVAVGLLVAFALLYLYTLWRLPTGPWGATAVGVGSFAVLAGLTAAVCALIGPEGLGAVPFVTAAALYVFPLRSAVTVALVVAAIPVISDLTGFAEPGTGFLSVICLVVGAIVLIVRQIEGKEWWHRSLVSELQIAGERDRVARDVHDVLGHSLTVVAAKAELADRVLDDDPERAHRELGEIRSLTREALAEIRATVAGLRVARLSDELDAAAEALGAAGIVAALPADPDEVDPRHRIVLAWVLRETVTNVVRHSGATRCSVEVTDRGLTVTDDGRGINGTAEGNGLRGVRERVAGAGGTVDVRRGPGGAGTTVEVAL